MPQKTSEKMDSLQIGRSWRTLPEETIDVTFERLRSSEYELNYSKSYSLPETYTILDDESHLETREGLGTNPARHQAAWAHSDNPGHESLVLRAVTKQRSVNQDGGVLILQ